MPSASDVYITPASKKIEFYESSAVKGKVYQDGSYFRIRSEGVPLAFEGDSGNHYFIRGSAQNRLFVYNYSAGTGYGTYAADYLELRDGSSNREAYVVAGNGSFVSGNFAIGTSSAGEKLHVVGNGRFTGNLAIATSSQPTSSQAGARIAGILQLDEKGSVPTHAAGTGILWVKNDSPANLYFTDDDDNDIALTDNGSAAGGGGGTIGGSVSANYIPYASSADTLANFALAYTEADNIIIGTTPASITTDADGNTSLGAGALNKITDGDKNVAVGMYAARSGTTAKHSVAVGHEAARLGITGNYNVSVGYQANYSGTKDANVIIGYQAAVDAATQSGSVAIGYRAARYPQGNYNTAIGMQALQGNASVTTAYNNVAVGYQAGHDITSGYRNTLVGYAAGYDIESGLDNTLIGQQAGANITTGPRNTIVGSYAGDALTTADGVVAIGYAALGAGAGASYDVAIGYEAHSAGTSSGVFIGLQAGANLAGVGTFIGKEAGESATEEHAVLIGTEAGKNSATNHTVAIGHASAATADAVKSQFMGSYAGGTWSGNNSTVIGYQAGYSGTNTTQNDNIAIGYQSMLGGNYSVSNIRNVAMGVAALKFASGSSYNVAIGYGSMLAADQESISTVAIGYYALSGATSTQATVAVGHLAARDLTTGDHNIAIGKSAMLGNTTSNYSTAIGSESMQLDGAGTSTTVGYYSMNAHSGDNCVGLGAYALRKGTGAYNVGLGVSAMTNVSGGVGGVAVGYQSGYHPTGNYNTFVGYNAGFGTAAGGGYTNVGIGKEALMNISSGYDNTAVGRQAGYSMSSALANVLVGAGAGYGITTAQKSVVIGNNAGYAMATQGGSVIIGFEAGRFQDAGSGGSVAIGHQALYSGTQNYQNVALGYNAGRKATGASSSNVYLGTHAGPSSAGAESNKLYINNAEGTPLIGGDFSAGEVTINASSKSITLDPYFAVSGDNQYSMISGSAGLALYGGNSYTDIWIDGQNSRQLRLRSVASDGSFDAGSFLEVFPSSVGATGDATANIRASSGDLYLYSVGSNNIALDSHHNLQFFFDNEYNMYSAADGNTRFTIRAASVAGMEFDGSSKIAFKNAATTKMTLDTAQGRLGIGTTAPAYTLDVGSGYANAARLYLNDSKTYIMGDSNNLYLRADDDMYFNIDTDNESTDKKFIWRSNTATELMRLQEDGKLGIGTGAPNVELDVVGDARIRGSNKLYFGDTDTTEYIRFSSDDLQLHSGDDISLNVVDDVAFNAAAVKFQDTGGNTHLTIQETGTNSALLSGANSAGLYFATQSGTRLELTGNHIIKTGQTIDNMLPYNTAAVHTATTATQVYQIEAQANPGQAGVTHTVTLNLPNGNVGGERFTVTCIAIGSFKPGTGNLTGEVVLGGTFINGTNLLSPTVTSITGATAAGQSVMQVKTFEFTWVASQFNPSGIGGWVYTVNTM